MKPFSELTGGEKAVEVIRWVCVLPAALFGALAVQLLLGITVQLADYGGWNFRGDTNIAFWTRAFLFHALRESAFVIAGARMAPRHQIATAFGLAVLGIGLSLMTHLIVQQLAGNRVGFVNYLHFGAEAAGGLGGAAYIFRRGSAPRAKRTG